MQPLHPTTHRGRFITVEGLDGVGKSTQLDRLTAWLRDRGHDPVVTAEPGGTALGAAIEQWLKHGDETFTPRAEVLLFLAARAEHVEQVIRPALAAGRTVLCSRFTHSTLAYQCHGLGLDEAQVRAADAFARDGVWPDLVLLFEAPDALLAERLGGRAPRDRIEARAEQFRRRVAAGFARLAGEEPERVIRIDAGGSPDEVHAAVVAALEGRL